MQSLAAIADPTRRRIVELLAERERTSGELAQKFCMSAPAVSQHLNVLRTAGLVTTRVQGQSRVQSLNPNGLDEVDAWLRRTREFWSRNLDALERELQADATKNNNHPPHEDQRTTRPIHHPSRNPHGAAPPRTH